MKKENHCIYWLNIRLVLATIWQPLQQKLCCPKDKSGPIPDPTNSSSTPTKPQTRILLDMFFLIHTLIKSLYVRPAKYQASSGHYIGNSIVTEIDVLLKNGTQLTAAAPHPRPRLLEMPCKLNLFLNCDLYINTI
jgi:hypothetical protein